MDFVKDLNPKPLYFARQLDLMPEYVKKAAPITEQDLADLSNAAFADEHRREFPLHNKIATWLSATYALGTGVTDPGIHSRIKAAAALFGVTEDVTVMETAFQAQIKEASAPQRTFALTTVVDGAPASFYPLNTPDEIVQSGRAIIKDADAQHLPPLLYRQAAIAVVKAASASGLEDDLHPRLRAMGTQRLPNFEHAKLALSLRKQAGISDEAAALYEGVLVAAEANPDDMDKFVALWTDLDRTCGIKYAMAMPNAFDSFFQDGVSLVAIEKMASENVIIEGVMIPQFAIPTVTETVVRQHFSKAAAESIIDAQKQAGIAAELGTDAFAKVEAENRRTFLQLLAAA